MQYAMRLFAAFLVTFCLILPQNCFAKNGKIRFASVAWTGVTVKTQVAIKILDLLGYDADNTILSVPLIYKSMEQGRYGHFPRQLDAINEIHS